MRRYYKVIMQDQDSRAWIEEVRQTRKERFQKRTRKNQQKVM